MSPAPAARLRAYAASVGHSVWFSDDLGERWQRAHTHRAGLYNECRVWSLALDPARPGELLAGTDQGLYRWREAEERFRLIPSPMDGLHILKVMRHPADPDWILCGTRPAALFASRDDGASWVRLPLPVEPQCPLINTPRVTSLRADPRLPRTLWVTVEIAGIFRSDDAGASWRVCNEGLLTPDVHRLLIFDDCPAAGGKRLMLAATEEGLHRSLDGGERWEPAVVPAAPPWRYARALAARADGSGTCFLSVGDRPSGEVGLLLRSRDFGESWEPVDLPGGAGTTIWWIATTPAEPMLMLACSIFGAVWRSRDGGETWQRSPRTLGELREVALAPAAP